MTTYRRHFLFQAAAVAAAFQLRGPFSFAEQEADQSGPPSAKGLLEALGRARKTGRPLLVIVVPDDLEGMSEWGQRWGEFTGYAAPHHLALLSLVDLYCADWSTLRKAVEPDWGALSAVAPVACLLDTERDVVRLCDPKWSPIPRTREDLGRRPNLNDTGTPEEFRQAFEDWEANRRSHPKIRKLATREQIRVLGEALEQTILPDRATLERLAEKARSAAGEDLTNATDERLAELVPAALWAKTVDDPKHRTEALRLLSDRVQERLRSPIPGSLWARREFCSVQIEGQPWRPSGIMCGMASIPKMSRRFLKFYGTGYWG